MKRIVGMILVVAMVASLVIVSVFAADTREDEMPATCIAEITESGEVIYYVEDEPKENDEATEPATWVADVDEDEEDSPIIIRASDLILDENLSDVETSRGDRHLLGFQDLSHISGWPLRIMALKRCTQACASAIKTLNLSGIKTSRREARPRKYGRQTSLENSILTLQAIPMA